MMYIQIDSQNVVTFTHNKPFDDSDGLGKTPEELSKTGFLLEPSEQPILESVTGKEAVLKYNPSNNSLYYEYVERAETPQDFDAKLKEVEDRMDTAILEMTTLMMMMGGLPNV